MTRILLFAVGLVGVISSAPGQPHDPVAPRDKSGLPVAPPPREIRSDGTRDPAPTPEVVPAENPVETVGRIIQNSKAVGEKLAKTDTGADTQTTQDKILKDIDSLINRQDPPSGGGGGSDNPNDKNDQNKDKNDQNKDKNQGQGDGQKNDKTDSSNGKGGESPKNGGMPPPMGGDQKQANNGRRPRAGSDKPDRQPKSPGKDKGSETAGKNDPTEKKDPMPGGKSSDNPMNGKDPMASGGGNPNGKAAKPSLPLEDEVVKDVWGHLPDKLRQQVTQYYKEQFMPKYADLLKQYYSSLANTPPKPLTELRR